MKNELRPINIIYIGLTATKNLKVVNYIKNMSKQIGDNIKGMFHYDAAKMIYSFKSGTETLAEISFVSAESKDPGVGDYADLIIIDEAAKIPRSIFEGIEPIVLTE
jgi:tRNA(Met) C34 N-acetyltransferase TmcA